MTSHASCGRLVHVSGRVQGVGFRAATADQARRLGLAGYAANLADGRVEVLVFGAPEAVSAMADWLAEGPPAARVREVSTKEVAPESADVPDNFRIR